MATSSQPSEPARDSKRGVTLAWVLSTYFAEGFPYSIVNGDIAKLLFTELGTSLSGIGLTSLFHLPWNLKFLWGPLLDRFETKRYWLIGIEVLLTACLVAFALPWVRSSMPVLVALLLLISFMSATHDIAIDGFYLECLNEEEQSRYVGGRASAYKVATVAVNGGAVMLIGRYGWTLGLWALAAVMLLLTVIHMVVLPRSEQRQRSIGGLFAGMLRLRARMLLTAGVVVGVFLLERRFGVIGPAWASFRAALATIPVLGKISLAGWISFTLLLAMLVLLGLRGRIKARLERSDAPYARTFVDFLDQPKSGRVLAFVVLFRCGESLLFSVKVPFLRRFLELGKDQIGLANGVYGLGASLVATAVGGWLISRQGLRRWIWPFVIAQNLLNLLYVALAVSGKSVPFEAVAAVICVEHFGQGLGTAVFMIYLMRCCDPRHKAAHMAIVTALMSVSFTIAGIAGGAVAELIGYSGFFFVSFLATIPGMALIPFVPHLDGREPR